MKTKFLLVVISLWVAPLQAWTLVGQSVLGWSPTTLTINVNSQDCGISEETLFSAIDKAITLWNSVPSSGLRLRRGTSTTTVSEFRDRTATDVPVILCDPNFSTTLGTNPNVIPGASIEIAASPNLNYGGVLLNAQTGSAASLAELDTLELELVIAHELGHVLGLGHSSDTSALMYFSISNKTELLANDDDRDGLSFLYPANGLQRNPFGCSSVKGRTVLWGGWQATTFFLFFLAINFLGGRWWYRKVR